MEIFGLHLKTIGMEINQVTFASYTKKDVSLN
jgi:hypothetical protein